VYRIQVQGLVTRMRATGTKKLVIGVSGGLDSTQALIVCARAYGRAQAAAPEHPRLLPCPASRPRRAPKSQAWQLMRAIGATAEEIDIRPSCKQIARGHRASVRQGQEGLRHHVSRTCRPASAPATCFRLANLHGGMVVGHRRPVELALGWATYGVGDHMSHYNVNASVPKTLISSWWLGGRIRRVQRDVKRALKRVLETEISPELVPGSQKSEASVGPYELQDFNLYYILRFGYAPTQGGRSSPGTLAGEYSCARSASGSACSCSASSATSSSAARCRTRRRWARAARSRRAATGARLRTAAPTPG
jgi:NAD+ synthase (glutamine-hydrolysing)